MCSKSIDRRCYWDSTVYLRDPILHEIMSRLGNCVQLCEWLSSNDDTDKLGYL